MTQNEIKVFCPATIANISCGFDVLGLALGTVGDEMVIRKAESPGIVITRITGQDLPLEAQKNVAGVAGLAMLESLNYRGGFELEIHKKIKAGFLFLQNSVDGPLQRACSLSPFLHIFV